MKTIAMIMTLAAGVSAFALSASAENATIEAGTHMSKARPAAVLSGVTNDFQSGFLAPGNASGTASGKQPAWVVYGSTRQ